MLYDETQHQSPPDIHTRLNIEVDVAQWTLRVGAYTYCDLPLNWPCWSEKKLELKIAILEANQIPIHPWVEDNSYLHKDAVKEVNQWLASRLGPRFYRNVTATVFKHFVLPIEALAYRYCFITNGTSHSYDTWLLRRLHRNLEMVKQVDADGLRHIVPFVLIYEKDPASLKREFGKGLWKLLCRNSYTRNRKILQCMQMTLGSAYHERPIAETAPMFRALNEFRSGVLDNFIEGTTLFMDGRNWVAQRDIQLIYIKWLWTHVRTEFRVNNDGVPFDPEFYACCRMYLDAVHMSEQMGIEIMPPKGGGRIRQWHDAVLNKWQTYKHNYTEEPFNWSDKLGHANGQYGEVACTVLNSPKSMADEGKNMEHCLASYITRAKNGDYIAMSLTEGTDAATLGMRLERGKYIFDQIYGYDNTVVTNDAFYTATEQIIRRMNAP